MNREFAHLPAGSAGAASFVHLIGKRIALLVHYRFLIYNLIVRDLKTRYRNSVLGFLWSLLNPLGMMLVFTIISPLLFRDQTIVNYPVFLLSGILPWNFFSASIMTGTNSVVASSHLIKKVYFPPEVLPIATILANLINFLLALLVLFALIIISGVPLSPWLWLLPIVILIQTTFALGIVFFLSTLQVYYRDTLLIMDVVMLAWFFLTPVFYSASILPTTYEVLGVTLNVQRLMYILNPMASLINMHRDILYWGYRTDPDFFWRTLLTALTVLGTGYVFFVKRSGEFGEEL